MMIGLVVYMSRNYGGQFQTSLPFLYQYFILMGRLVNLVGLLQMVRRDSILVNNRCMLQGRCFHLFTYILRSFWH